LRTLVRSGIGDGQGWKRAIIAPSKCLSPTRPSALSEIRLKALAKSMDIPTAGRHHQTDVQHHQCSGGSPPGYGGSHPGDERVAGQLKELPHDDRGDGSEHHCRPPAPPEFATTLAHSSPVPFELLHQPVIHTGAPKIWRKILALSLHVASIGREAQVYHDADVLPRIYRRKSGTQSQVVQLGPGRAFNPFPRVEISARRPLPDALQFNDGVPMPERNACNTVDAKAMPRSTGASPGFLLTYSTLFSPAAAPLALTIASGSSTDRYLGPAERGGKI